MEIITVIHNYYEQILIKFIFARLALLTDSSVLPYEKENGISKFNQTKQKARHANRKKNQKTFFRYFQLTT